MLCKKCGKELNENAKFCEECGTAVENQKQNDIAVNSYNQKPNKKSGCIIACIAVIILCFMVAMFSIIVMSVSSPKNNEVSNTETDYKPIFDSQVFYTENKDSTISPEELVKLMGQPDSINNYNYESLKNGYSEKYPITEYMYGDWSYKFNNGYLQRISFMGSTPIKYESKDDFLKMFGCEKNTYTNINDTNSAYRAYNCGVKSLWLGYDEQGIQWIHIDYSDLF